MEITSSTKMSRRALQNYDGMLGKSPRVQKTTSSNSQRYPSNSIPLYEYHYFKIQLNIIIFQFPIAVIGATKRSHSYARITPESSISSINGGFDVTSLLNWGSFESDNQSPDNFSDSTLSTFIHELSLHSSSNSTQCTWLNQGTVSHYL